jgi:hypothetical protein
MDSPAQPPNQVQPPPPRAFWLCAAFVLIGLLLRLPFLGRSVWFDEACMSDQRVGTWEQLLATLYVDIHPPLYATFMHFWDGLFGDGALSMRMPSLLCGLTSIPLLFWTGRWFVGDTAALWGALLLAISPVHIWYSAEASLYAPMVFCTLLFVGTFERLITHRSPRRRALWTVHLLNLAVMLSLHYYLAVFVMALAVLAPVAARGFSTTSRHMLLLHGIGILLLGGFVLAKRALGEFEMSQEYMRPLDLGELYRLVFDWCWTGHTLVAVDQPLDRCAAWAQEALGLGLVGAGLVQVVRTRREFPNSLLVPVFALLIPGFLIVSAAAGLGNTYIERSCIATLPFVFLLAGAGLTSLPRGLYHTSGAVTLLLGMASILALFRHYESDWTVYKPNSDWHGASTYLAAEIDAGATGRAVFTSTPNPRSLSYYDVRVQDVKNLTDTTDPAHIGNKVDSKLGQWFGDYAESTFRTLAAHNKTLLDGAALRIYRSTSNPAGLDLAHRSPDQVCYLVRDQWHPHPSRDHTIEDLLQHPAVHVLETKRFPGIAVYKVRIDP